MSRLISGFARRINRRSVAVIVAAAAMLGVGAGVAVAATTGHAGQAVTRVSVLTQNAAAVYTSAAYTNVGTTTVYATKGQFITARFTAETACVGASGWCSVRILIDGAEAEPVVGTDFAFDDAGTAVSWESHSVERVRTVAATGFHLVTVQVADVGTGVSDRLDDWTLVAEAVAA